LADFNRDTARRRCESQERGVGLEYPCEVGGPRASGLALSRNYLATLASMSNSTPFAQATVFPQSSNNSSQHGGDVTLVASSPEIEKPVVCSEPTNESSQVKAVEAAVSEPLGRLFEEKREFPRIPFRGRAKAVVFPLADNLGTATIENSEVLTSDLSRGGISILHRTQLAPGQQMMLMLDDSMQLAEVKWCCRVWDELFAAGCRFLTDTRDCDVGQKLAAIDVVISSEELWWDLKESS